MSWYPLILTLHIISSTVLFGTGMGTAFQMVASHYRADVRAMAVTAKNVVLADWLFTTTSGFIQPVTGVALAYMVGFPLTSSWLEVTYVLYVLALICWLPVVGLQMRIARLAGEAAAANMPLPRAYHRAYWTWFWLGWPAFGALIVVFYLMTAKPALW
jgi:uncharacterized membrane protein